MRMVYRRWKAKVLMRITSDDVHEMWMIGASAAETVRLISRLSLFLLKAYIDVTDAQYYH